MKSSKSTFVLFLFVVIFGLVFTGAIGSPYNYIANSDPTKPTKVPIRGVPVGSVLSANAGNNNNQLHIDYIPFITLAPQTPVPTRVPTPTVAPTLVPTIPANTPVPNQPTPTPEACTNSCNNPVDTWRPYDPSIDGPCPAYLMECKAQYVPDHVDIGGPFEFECANVSQQAERGGPSDEGFVSCSTFQHGWCWDVSQPGVYCFGKPVIYLYPTKDTAVDVNIQTSGIIVVSDPLYPENGWQQVLAHPNGNLEYKNKAYRELFYETSVSDFKKPTGGIILKTENLEQELDHVITQLGLINEEKTEFLDYWIPKLKNLNSPYILFSIIDKSEKEKTDNVIITPKPDTFIQFIAYFKPLTAPITLTPLTLPNTPPRRLGFTAVEWGGTIDY